MTKKLRKPLSLIVALAMCLSFVSFSGSVTADATSGVPSGLRPMEYLTRGLVAAQVPGGIFLSWRFLGDEPDGISWNVYRDGELITTIAPRDVAPESDYETNPGIVKENTTPTNYTDAAGTLASVYEVAPVIGGVEGDRQGMSVPMLDSLGTGSNANKGAVHYITMKPAPDRVPLAHFSYRGNRFGPGTNMTAADMVIAGTGGQHWYVIDMELLRAFREPYQAGTAVTQEDLNGWVAKLNTYNTTPNVNGVKTYETPTWAPATALPASGIIPEALFDELEAEFIKYVMNLDCGTRLPYARTEGGAIHTSQSSAYATNDMTVGDFDGDGEYEIVVKWRANQQDPMYSEPIFSGTSTTTAPEYIDVYKLDGTLMFRVDMGYSVRAGNDHETTLFAGDFDGDGKSELMLKTALGTRIGNWDEETKAVIYPDTLQTVVGGVDGLNATTDKFKEYFAAGNAEALDTYWALLNSFTISYRSPIAGGGNDGPNDLTDAPSGKQWIKTYHVGPIGPAKDDQEFFTAFEWDAAAGKGVIVDSVLYPYTYVGSVDGDNWAMTPCSQRGAPSNMPFPGPESGSSPNMRERDSYWITNPWKAAAWGDAQGNRANRYVGAVAALDGVNYYAVSERGYYHRTTFAAYNLIGGRLNLQATFDSANPECWALGGTSVDYQNLGNHHLSSGDLDGDGWDEIVMKAMILRLNETKDKIVPIIINGDIMPTIEAQPTRPTGLNFATDEVRNNPLNKWFNFNHGDRSALLPMDKSNKLVYWSGNEESTVSRDGRQLGWKPGPAAHDPLKGKKMVNGQLVYENALIYGVYSGGDDEGSVAGNFSNRFPGAQGGSSSTENAARSLVTGEVVGASTTARGIAQGQNAIWWDGDLVHEGANSSTIYKLNDNTFTAVSYFATGLTSTGFKNTPTLKADLLGDWREELVLRGSNNRLAIVTTLSPTNYGIRNLMHDPLYRQGVANKNAGYDQCGFASFYLGDEAPLPSQRTDIYIPKVSSVTSFSVSPVTYVEALSANIRYNIEGLNLDGAVLSLELDGQYYHLETASGIVNIPVMPDEGTYVVRLWLGNDVVKETVITVLPLPTDIWEPSVIKLDDGKIGVLFAAELTNRPAKPFTATIGGEAVAVSLDSTNAHLVIVDAQYEAGIGKKIVLAKIYMPLYFPSYTFTYTVTVK